MEFKALIISDGTATFHILIEICLLHQFRSLICLVLLENEVDLRHKFTKICQLPLDTEQLLLTEFRYLLFNCLVAHTKSLLLRNSLVELRIGHCIILLLLIPWHKRACNEKCKRIMSSYMMYTQFTNHNHNILSSL